MKNFMSGLKKVMANIFYSKAYNVAYLLFCIVGLYYAYTLKDTFGIYIYSFCSLLGSYNLYTSLTYKGN